MGLARSRATLPSGAPYEWRRYINDDHPAVKKFVRWLESLVPFARKHLLGEYYGLLELAEQGRIAHDDPPTVTRIKPLRKRPEMWELRWTMHKYELRQYHGEPSSEPSLLVALHLHLKTGPDVPAALVQRLQNSAIAYAARRFRDGAKLKWIAPAGTPPAATE